MKASEDSVYDGEESRDTLLDASFDAINTTVEETPVVPETTKKRVTVTLQTLNPLSASSDCSRRHS